MRVELFQIKRAGGKNKILIIENIGDTVRTEHGQENGKMQKSERICTPVNVGKKNERSGEAQAEFEARAKVKKKIREGYSIRGEAAEEVPLTSTSSKHGAVISLDDLPEAFAPSKPIQTVPIDFLIGKQVNPESHYFGERKNNGVNL